MFMQHVARRELHPELRILRAAIVFADGQPVFADIPAIGGAEFHRLDTAHMQQDAFGERRRAWRVEISIVHLTAKLVAGVRHAFRAHVKADAHAVLIFCFVVKKVRRARGHQTAVAGLDLCALIALSDDAVALEIHRDFIALGVQVFCMRGAGAEDRMEDGGCAAVRAADRQTKFRDRPAIAFLHVFGPDVVDMDEVGGIHKKSFKNK